VGRREEKSGRGWEQVWVLRMEFGVWTSDWSAGSLGCDSSLIIRSRGHLPSCHILHTTVRRNNHCLIAPIPYGRNLPGIERLDLPFV
jgi:hypothetical protein